MVGILRGLQDTPKFGDFILASAVGTMVLLASLANFLAHGAYPVLTIEVAALVVCLIAVVALVSLCYALAPSVVRVAMEIALLAIALELNFEGWWVVAGLILVAIVATKHLMTVLGVASAVVLASELAFAVTFLPRDDSAPEQLPVPSGKASLPPIVHIILDEHLGLKGLEADANGPEVASRIRSLYEKAGFRVFGGARSDFMYTADSIPFVLNFGEPQPWINDDKPVAKNRYFDQLKSSGYEIAVFQTFYMDFCAHSAVSRCWEYPKTPLLALRSGVIPITDRIVYLAREFASLTMVFRVASIWLGDPQAFLASPYPAVAIQVLDKVIEHVAHPARGSALFVHVLAPHYPYVLDRTCKTKRLQDWGDRRNMMGEQDRNLMIEAYHEQLDCLLTKMKSVIDTAGSEAIIVVHGDHGSRITRVRPAIESIGSFDDEDLVVSFSTLFAVRAPGISAGYEEATVSVSRLIEELARSGFGHVSIDASAPQHVFLVSRVKKARPGELNRSVVYPLSPDWLTPARHMGPQE
jgi:hypothetical protein